MNGTGAQLYLERVLQVCRQLSDYRHYQGSYNIFYLSAENARIMACLQRFPKTVATVFPWTIDAIERNDLFFENLLSALCPTYPDVGFYPLDHPDFENHHIDLYFARRSVLWTGRDYSHELIRFENSDSNNKEACLNRVLKVCRYQLFERLKSNRQFMASLMHKRYAAVFNRLAWCRGHLTSLDIFFMNLYRALQRLIENPGKPDLPDWPGRDHSFLLFAFESQQDETA